MDVLVQGASRGLGLALTRRLLDRPGVARVFVTSRDPASSEGLRRLRPAAGPRLVPVALDLRRPASIDAAAERVRHLTSGLHLLVNSAGVLHEGALTPEKRLEQVDGASLRHAFEVNAFGPLLVARAFLDLLDHGERAVLANLSARVGSIADNRRGGWYGYRASKAAQNMFTRTLALELRRRAPAVVCVALHPGTVATELSRPFARSVPRDRLLDADTAAARLLRVMDGLGADDSGGFFDGDGLPVPW